MLHYISPAFHPPSSLYISLLPDSYHWWEAMRVTSYLSLPGSSSGARLTNSQLWNYHGIRFKRLSSTIIISQSNLISCSVPRRLFSCLMTQHSQDVWELCDAINMNTIYHVVVSMYSYKHDIVMYPQFVLFHSMIYIYTDISFDPLIIEPFVTRTTQCY